MHKIKLYSKTNTIQLTITKQLKENLLTFISLPKTACYLTISAKRKQVPFAAFLLFRGANIDKNFHRTDGADILTQGPEGHSSDAFFCDFSNSTPMFPARGGNFTCTFRIPGPRYLLCPNIGIVKNHSLSYKADPSSYPNVVITLHTRWMD